MKQEKFDKVVNERLEKIKNSLLIKAKQYVRDSNCMYNFDKGAERTRGTREKVLYGFLLKHLICFEDMIQDIENNKLPTELFLEELTGDIINYMILFEASVKDKLVNNSKNED